jgi:proteic killer suppression protein
VPILVGRAAPPTLGHATARNEGPFLRCRPTLSCLTETKAVDPVSLIDTPILTAVSFNDTQCVIRNFREKTTQAVFNGESPKGFPADLVKVARRKLRYLNAAGDLGDLRSPPGNRLEALAGDRKGQHSVRINDQFQVCFVWTAEGPADVEFVDYH